MTTLYKRLTPACLRFNVKKRLNWNRTFTATTPTSTGVANSEPRRLAEPIASANATTPVNGSAGASVAAARLPTWCDAPWAQGYAALHRRIMAGELPAAETRFLLLRPHERAGLGNRLRAVSGALALAVCVWLALAVCGRLALERMTIPMALVRGSQRAACNCSGSNSARTPLGLWAAHG